jgi:hypothetical protein
MKRKDIYRVYESFIEQKWFFYQRHITGEANLTIARGWVANIDVIQSNDIYVLYPAMSSPGDSVRVLEASRAHGIPSIRFSKKDTVQFSEIAFEKAGILLITPVKKQIRVDLQGFIDALSTLSGAYDKPKAVSAPVLKTPTLGPTLTFRPAGGNCVVCNQTKARIPHSQIDTYRRRVIGQALAAAH